MTAISVPLRYRLSGAATRYHADMRPAWSCPACAGDVHPVRTGDPGDWLVHTYCDRCPWDCCEHGPSVAAANRYGRHWVARRKPVYVVVGRDFYAGRSL